jgi:apolipoprotein D and lipocalin family protein
MRQAGSSLEFFSTRFHQVARYFYRSGACAALLSILFLAGCSGTAPNTNPRAKIPLQTVPVDLPRYMGRWYVIANIPYFAERDFVGSYAQWELRTDGKINDSFYGRKKSFAAELSHYQFLDTPVAGSGGGLWSVRLFWPLYAKQLTLYVDPDYRYTLLGYPDKSLGWIFSREPVMSDEVYRDLLARFNDMGYDTSRFRHVPQRPKQLGQPGFASPGDKN